MIEGPLDQDPLEEVAQPRPAGKSRATMGPAAARWALAVFVLLAFGLRMYDLGRREFWFDEALTANVSSLGWEGIVSHLRSAPFEHPPLYFLTLYPWQKLAGSSEFAFRFVSVLWGVLFVPLFYVLLRRWTGRPLALLAVFLAVLSPFLVAYSQEARMYSLLPCLAALALLVFVVALQREGQRAWWLAYLALLVVGTATHYFFAFIWLVTALYLGIDYARQRRLQLWPLAAHVLLLVASVIWLAAAPGLRASLVRVLQGEAAFGLAYKLNKIMPTLILSEVSGGQVPVTAHLVASGGWLLILLGVWTVQRRPMLKGRGRLLLLLTLVVPLVAALLLPYGVIGRHLGYVLLPALTFVAAGLVALQRRGGGWLALGIVLLLLPISYGLAVHYTRSGGDLGQAMAYIDEHARTGDLVILSQPVQDPLVTYYNRGGWPVRYLPANSDPLTPEEVDDALPEMARLHDRLWLGPVGAWTGDPDLLAERWLAANTFQASKIWFPDSSSVALYYTAGSDLEPVDVERGVWAGRIRLHALAAGPLEVRPGEALRLQFGWLATLDLDEAYAVSLQVVDEGGLVWADRRSGPCAGWCPTDSWQAADFLRDRHAVLIPPGTPPGSYHLQVAWVPADGGAPLPVETGAGQARYLTLAEVVVLPLGESSAGPASVPNPVQVTFGEEVRLLGYQVAPAELQAGQELRLETHWQAVAAPVADYALAVDLVDGSGQVVHGWRFMPFTGQYGTGAWWGGEYLRSQQALGLPGSLPAGAYRLRIALLAPDGGLLQPGGQVEAPARLEGAYLFLARVDVVDRPRRFELPEVSSPLEARLGRRARLVGYDLDQGQAYSGGQVTLILYWQALGPMVQPFKVFTHLVDDRGEVLAQHDGQPGSGCCPANTWVEGEVIVDEHVISLRSNLPPGGYGLVVGMYDEETLAALPAYDKEGNRLDADGVLIGVVDVRPPPGGMPTPTPDWTAIEFDHALYLPLIAR